MSRPKNRIVALLLGLTLALTVAGCGKDDAPSNDVGSFEGRSVLAL